MNIKVNIEVKFESGAVVNLTESQKSQVSKYVGEVVFGTVTKEKRKYVRKAGKRRSWTPEELNSVLELEALPRGRDKTKAAKKLSLELKRTRPAISQKGVELRKEGKLIKFTPNGFGNYKPLDILSSGYLGK